jgi:hypothetical protein
MVKAVTQTINPEMNCRAAVEPVTFNRKTPVAMDRSAHRSRPSTAWAAITSRARAAKATASTPRSSPASTSPLLRWFERFLRALMLCPAFGHAIRLNLPAIAIFKTDQIASRGRTRPGFSKLLGQPKRFLAPHDDLFPKTTHQISKRRPANEKWRKKSRYASHFHGINDVKPLYTRIDGFTVFPDKFSLLAAQRRELLQCSSAITQSLQILFRVLATDRVRSNDGNIRSKRNNSENRADGERPSIKNEILSQAQFFIVPQLLHIQK